ncbi:hypothetical protein BPS10C_197 [Bacillus phage BPS10C]|uniref:Uncharacterized protein n=1 Tax=Bacillus phage BPS10C TaxID=1277886 RepID=W5QUR2_9CAUD|nr:hypothetical protein BPS10C_197 [Bacillus phage BPS10C]AGI12194.1 hypothetical protein BPS10C_197 [Bacillus phage BPS10C]
MYKSINLGLLASGKKLLEMLSHSVMYAGFDNGMYNYYYMRGNTLYRIRYRQTGELVTHAECGLGFNVIAKKSMSVAGNAALVPEDLGVTKEGTFMEASKIYREINCSHEYYAAVCNKNEKVNLNTFLARLVGNFTSDDISEILNSNTFSVGIDYDEFKEIIRGGK